MVLRRYQATALQVGLAVGAFAIMMSLATSAPAQQYQNFEVTPDGRGGAQGAIGGRNFEVYRNYDRPPASRRTSPDTRREERNPVPQQTCIIDAEGRTRCK
ncbi:MULTISPECIES: hypothetical protein [unclassified Rhizobium]|uniref:hypothetical protein n=1 Tax=unclassified Rhizobium TaxID=2613769 RepID=UPI00247B2599|nr:MULTISPECIES: hypothetical protein [unclassified Rhizobium]MDH7802304.1 hypothetical protein [Rhizobium sp. AN70]